MIRIMERQLIFVLNSIFRTLATAFLQKKLINYSSTSAIFKNIAR